MADTNHDISILNDLIATTIDSVDGYRSAAEHSESSRYNSIFFSRATERQQVATTLKGEVSRLGGTPEDDGTVLAAGHRTFMKLKEAVAGADEQAIVNEVERGEDVIKARYERAMADVAVSPAVKAVISEAYRSVREGHDQMRDIKHALEGKA
jgi:uncharacterized protein (TIGR02284 family)